MAQIKKFQTPAGPITTAEEKTTPKYGRLIQNGIAIEATDDMIGWLSSQGYYGQQMASNLKNGVDQYVDVDENGVGSIKNIQVENPDLNERQQNKTTRRRRGLEGHRMSEARGAIDTLAGYDYSKFKVTPVTKKTYSWDNLEIDYNESTENGKTKYTFSDAGVNKDILARLDSLEKGLIIPEGYEFAKADEIRSYYNTIKDKIAGVKTNLQAGTLTDNDLDILNTLGIYQKGQLKSEASTADTKNPAVGELVSKLGMTEDQAKQAVNDFDFGEDGSMIAKQSITNKFGQNYLFGENELGGRYKGYALLDGKLYKTSSDFFKNWLSGDIGQAFIRDYNGGLWQQAAQTMSFYGANTPWEYYDPSSEYIDFITPGSVYRDISANYNLGTNLGVIEILDDQLDSFGRRKSSRYAISADGKLIDLQSSGVTEMPRPAENYISNVARYTHYTPEFRTALSGGKWYEIGDGYYVYVDTIGKRLFKKNRFTNTVSPVTNIDYTPQSSMYHIIQAITNAQRSKDARKLKNGGVASYAEGKPMKSSETKTYVPESIAITDTTKPYSLEDVKNGFNPNLTDIADITSLALDLVGFGFGEMPIWGELLGYASDLVTFGADISRDGFQLGDVGNLATNAGLTSVGLVPVLGTGTGVAKLINKTKKLAPVLNAGFMALGLHQGTQALSDIINGDVSVETVRELANGIMALRGLYKNRKSHKLVDEYMEPKTKASKTTVRKGVPDLLGGLSTKQQDEILDAVLKDKPQLKYLDGEMKNPAKDWFDGDKITDYDKAWEAIGSQLTEAEIKAHSPKLRSVMNTAGKAKDTAVEATESAWDWFKKQTTRANTDNYNVKSNIASEDLEMLKKLGWVPSNKNGGKVKKYSGGDDLVSLVESFNLPKISFDESGKIISPQSKEPEFKFDTSGPFFDTKSTIKQFGDEISKPKYEYKHATPKSSLQQIDLGKVGMNHDRLTRDSSGNIVTAKTLSSGSSDTVFGSGKKSDLVSRIGEGLLNGTMRAAAYLNTEATNRKVLNETINGIRRKYTGAQKSMPIGPVVQRYNLDPLITTFDDQKVDAWAQTREFNKSTSDQKLALANNQATAARITKGENALLDRISKQITEVDLANTQAHNLHLKDEQAIADYNRQLGGVQAAEEASARAQYEQKKGDNFNKMLAELRSDWNQYTASKDNMDLYNKYSSLFNEYNNPATTVERKAELKDKIGMLSYLIKQGSGVRNPFTYQRSWSI